MWNINDPEPCGVILHIMNSSLGKTFFSVLLSFAAAACAVKTNVAVSPSDTAAETAFTEAAALAARECYAPLRKACALYGDLYARPSCRGNAALPYLRTCLLLSVRQRELCILDRAALDAAARIIRENPNLAAYTPFLDMIDILGPLSSSHGTMEDMDESFSWIKRHRLLEKDKPALREKAVLDELLAYIYTTWSLRLCYPCEENDMPAAFLKVFPSSILLKYKGAIRSEEMNGDVLEQLAAAEPEFFEAHFHLGELRIRQKRLLGAEKELLTAYEGIPESPQIRILLGSIYLVTEEFEKAIEFYDRTLELAPKYRDALLGKALCLGYMGRHEEALPVLQRMLDLGAYLIGESEYWLAWNLNALGRHEEGLNHIDESKKRLPTNGEVFSLSGTIALALNRLSRAEKDFLDALVFTPFNTEALLGMGQVTARKGLWKDAGGWQEKAASSLDVSAVAIRARIQELGDSDLSAERKAALIRKKTAQLESALTSAAAARLQGAVCFLNAGDGKRAKDLAVKASENQVVKAKAEEFLKKLGAPAKR